VRDVSRQEQESGIYEKIELNSFTRDDLDIDLIERDVKETVSVMTSYLLTCGMAGNLNFQTEALRRAFKYEVLIQEVLQNTHTHTHTHRERERGGGERLLVYNYLLQIINL